MDRYQPKMVFPKRFSPLIKFVRSFYDTRANQLSPGKAKEVENIPFEKNQKSTTTKGSELRPIIAKEAFIGDEGGPAEAAACHHCVHFEHIPCQICTMFFTYPCCK